MDAVFTLILLILLALIAIPIYIYFLISIIDGIVRAIKKYNDNIKEGK